jgi:hypothetical protein
LAGECDLGQPHSSSSGGPLRAQHQTPQHPREKPRLVTDERIERPTAERFLQRYYEQAVPAADRRHAWDMLTVGFQENDEKLREGNLTGRDAYDAFFNKWRKVEIGQVDSVAGEPNKFEAYVTYIWKETGRRTPPHRMHYQLFCPSWIKKIPFRNCKPEDIKLEDSVQKEIIDG